ncbi:hypothetical protein V3C99_001273 [Haemonchus contortus]
MSSDRGDSPNNREETEEEGKEQERKGAGEVIFDREKHKQQVKRMKLIKQKRRMKMVDRHDDIRRDGSDMEFVASTLPEEEPQEQWLNDLLGPSSCTTQDSQFSSISLKDQKEGNQAHFKDTCPLSCLILRAEDTIANHPLALALIIMVAVLIHWFCYSSQS